MADEEEFDEEEHQEEGEEEWNEEEEQHDEEPPPPPEEEEEVAEEAAEEEAAEEEAVEEAVSADKFVVGGKEDMTEAELRVEYQAALSTVLLVELQNPDAPAVTTAAAKLDDFFQTEEHAVHTDCFCALGGHGLLLMLLQKWKDDQGIQELLFSCLANLSKWARNNDPNVISTILIMRGMDLIADSMQRFADSGKLYVDGLVTITCLCRKEELDRHATTRSSIIGAVPLVCKAIKAFPENRDVLNSGCHALKTFCEMNLDQIKDLKGEAISVVGASLQNFPDDHEINQIAFSFLFNLGSMCGYGADGTSAPPAKKEAKQEETHGEEAQSPPKVVAKKKWGGGGGLS